MSFGDAAGSWLRREARDSDAYRAVRIAGASDPSADGVYYRSRKWSGSSWRRALNTASVPAYGLGCLLIGLVVVPIAGVHPSATLSLAVGAGLYVMGCGALVARNLLR